MNITREEARRIADLAHLEFDDDGLDRMAGEMSKILSYIDQLAEVDVSDVVLPPAAPTPMREDVPRASIDRELAARNAPAWSDGFFIVPRVIGGEGAGTDLGGRRRGIPRCHRRTPRGAGRLHPRR